METAQSSTLASGRPANAYSSKVVDGYIGDHESNPQWDNISHTNADNEPYWWVKLGQRCSIDKVVIYNWDANSDVSSRFAGFRLEIFNEGIASPVYTYNAAASGNPGTVIDLAIPSETIGSQVKISIPGRSVYLHLREVQTYGYQTSCKPLEDEVR